MKQPNPEPSWPESWKTSYAYDLEEMFHRITNRGYAYAYQIRFQETLRLVEEVLPAGATIIDIAAAQGNFSLSLAERGYRVTWNDLRSELADYVKLKHTTGVMNYAPGNAFDLKFPEPFDCALITEVIEHVAHPDRFLRQVAQLVRPGGWIILTTPNGGYLRNNLPRFSDHPDPSVFEAVQFKPNLDGHIFLLHEDELRSLAAAAGLEVDSIRLLTNSLTTGHMKSEALLKVLPKSVVYGIERLTQSLPGFARRKLLFHLAARFRVKSAGLANSAATHAQAG